MSTVCQFLQFPRKALAITSQNLQPTSKPSLQTQTLCTRPSNDGWIGTKSKNLSISWTTRKRSFKVLAVPDDDEWGTEPGSSGQGTTTAQAVAEPPPVPSGTDRLKQQLVNAFYGTDRGLKASAETRAEIVELITQLEAKNPTPAPTQALSLLNGKWILAYTSFAGLYPLLSRGSLQLVKVEEISQTIDSEKFTVENSVKFSGPLASTSVSTNADFEIRSPKRVQIKFIEGIIGTPQLTDSIVFPDDLEIFGQKIDLSPLKGLLSSVQDTASSVAKTISSQPPFKFNLSNRPESWLLTTYLDEDLRISRADAGGIFVLLKEGSSLLIF